MTLAQRLIWSLSGWAARRNWAWKLWSFLSSWSPFYLSERGSVAFLGIGTFAELCWERFTWKPQPWRVLAKDDPRRRLDVPVDMPLPKGASVDWL